MSNTTNRKETVKAARQNLANYLVSYTQAVEDILSGPSTPISKGYCWIHEDEQGQPYGWRAHPGCEDGEVDEGMK